MKKAFALLLVFAMMFCLLAGCAPAQNDETDGTETEAVSQGSLENAQYVMIYNPNIFTDNTAYATNLQTGSLGGQIDTEAYRAEEIPVPETYIYPVSPGDLPFVSPDTYDPARAGGLDPVYAKNDSHDFFKGKPEQRVNATFSCSYEGTHCYIWTIDGSLSEEDAAVFGREFDDVIYPLDTEAFGKARFTENGGKVNILFYPMGAIGAVCCGFFWQGDLFSADEYPNSASKGMNVDHAIIHINSDMMGIPMEENIPSTIAHEFQHLICGTDDFLGGHMYTTNPPMDMWLDESMSAYAEQLYQPGSADEARAADLYNSELIRSGMSLYDFKVVGLDLGCYGAVMAYALYLSEQIGGSIFTDIHTNWGYYGGVSNTTDLVASALPDAFYDEINASVSYPEALTSRMTGNETIVSKLTLNFWLATLKADLYTVKEENVEKYRASQLYYSINPATVEGGGRIVFKTQDGRFDIPADADAGLIYVGLDEDFNVTEIVTTQP